MSKLKGRKSKFDSALFLWHIDNQLVGIVTLHVDDFIYCGTQSWLVTVMQVLEKRLHIGAHCRNTFKYIGLMVNQFNGHITVNQQFYIDSIKLIDLSEERSGQIDFPLTADEIKLLRSLCGQLLWATSQTRPDAAFEACIASNYGKNPTVKSLLLANKCARKLKGVSSSLVFPNLGNHRKLEVHVYADAAHANLPSGASQGGILVFLVGGGYSAPVLWQSKKLNRVVKGPFAAETMAAAEAADAGVLAANIAEEIFGVEKIKVICHTDSKSLVDHMETTNVITDHRLRIDIARLKEMVSIREVQMKWVPTEKNLADALTKNGAPTRRLLEVLRSGNI